MKYRKKPVVIEAYQTDKEMDIKTLEGTMHASVGDYIITGVRGEQYPCKPDIFEETYEPAEDRKSVWAARWVPVTEDLPKKAGRYLVCYHPCNDDRVDWTVKRVGLDSFKKSGWARAKYQRIIAWMPLPKEWYGDDVQTE